MEDYRTVEVKANPGYFRVPYNRLPEGWLADKKPDNRGGMSLAEALDKLGGKPVAVKFEIKSSN